MCYHEDWFYGWTGNEAARRRAQRKPADAAREHRARDHRSPEKVQPRPDDAPARPSEVEVEEIV